MSSTKKLLVISGILMFAVPFSRAEEKKETREKELKEIVVTGTRTPHTLEETPVETILITKDEIEKSNSKNVAEILRGVPGVFIQGENVPGASSWKTRLRGFSFDSGYGLILVDGERVLGGGMGEYGISLNQIPPSLIEKIEIVKGPASSLYGSDALAGVVNIITKDVPEKPLFYLSGGYGSHNPSLVSLGYGQKSGKFGFLVMGERDISDRGRYGARKDKFWGEYVLSKISYDFSEKIKLHLGVHYDYLRWQYAIEKKFRLSPSVEISLSDNSMLKLRAYYYPMKMDLFSPGYTRRYGDIKYLQGEAQYTAFVGKNQLFTVGSEYLFRDIDANFTNATDTIISFYLQDEISFLERVIVAAGGRIDNHSRFGTEFNPKIGVLWKIFENTRARVSAGRSFKSPTIRQLYVSFKHGDWWNEPNPELNPEIAWGYSLSLEQLFLKNFSLVIGAFRNDVKNMIVRVETSETVDGVPVRTWENVQEAFTQGLEAMINLTLFNSLSLNLAYTYMDTENKNTGKELPYSPHNMASTGFGCELKALRLSFHWMSVYYSKAYKDNDNTATINPYSISNLKVIGNLAKNVRVSFEVDNIFNSDYGEPQKEWLGRVFFGKLNIEI